jgi:hypothetical protein
MYRDGSGKKYLGSGRKPRLLAGRKYDRLCQWRRWRDTRYLEDEDVTKRAKLADDGYGRFTWFGVYAPSWQPLP